MKLFFIRFISMIVSVCMLAVFAGGAAPSQPYDVTDPETCVLNLSVFSDVHVESNNFPRFKVFADSLRGAMQNKSGSDAFIFLGDSTMNGQSLENMIFHGTAAQILKDQKIITVAGNHDFGNENGDFNALKHRWLDYTEAFFDRKLTEPYYYDIVNGFYFIVLASEDPENSFMYMSDDQFAWLEMMLEDAARSDLPVFILAHYPSSRAVPLNEDSPYDLISMLAEYNKEHDVFYLCGHMHRPPSSSTIHSRSGFPETCLPRLTELDGDDREIYEGSGFGEAVEVYPDRVIFRVRNFYTGEWAELDGEPLQATFTLKKPVTVR